VGERFSLSSIIALILNPILGTPVGHGTTDLIVKYHNSNAEPNSGTPIVHGTTDLILF
jgi:hypothetical protein